MFKKYRSLITCACLAVTFLTAGVLQVQAAPQVNSPEPVRIYGPIAKEGDGRISIDNQSGVSFSGQIILNTSPETTRILDAVTGYPVSYDNLKDGEIVYAYIGPAMTMSLPPMTNPTMILCNIPADFKVPDYIDVESMSWNSGKSQAVLTAVGGLKFTIPSDCQIIPYLTRNIVTLDDLTKSRTGLIWSDASGKASKIVLFAEAAKDSHGWTQENGNWYYYKDNGSLHTGWLLDNSKWYYLNPDNGMMQTGFLTLDGNTYYLLSDGSMMTTSKTFKPDKNGVLR